MSKCDSNDSPQLELEPLEQCFYSNRVLPDAAHLFDRKIPSLKDVINKCLVVLDTNVLLLPYAGRKVNIVEVLSVYGKIKRSNRLFIPAQVAREFNKNRPAKIADMHNALIQKIDNIKVPDIMYSVLEKEQEYIDLKDKIDKLDEQRKSINEAKLNLIRKIQEWTWNDPVSIEYGKIFTNDCIVEPDITDRKDEYNECKERYELKIPPGYKDSSKPDGGIGDYLIWKTILKIGKENKKHLIFVTGDEKADWQHRSNTHPLMPRYELFDEYWRHSEGNCFYICPLSRFLEHQNASKELVEEIRSEEEASNNEAEEIEVDNGAIKDLLSTMVRNSIRNSFSNKTRKIHIDTPPNGADDRCIDEIDINSTEIYATCPACSQLISIHRVMRNALFTLCVCDNCGKKFIVRRLHGGTSRVTK